VEARALRVLRRGGVTDEAGAYVRSDYRLTGSLLTRGKLQIESIPFGGGL